MGKYFKRQLLYMITQLERSKEKDCCQLLNDMIVLTVKYWIKQGWNNVDNKSKNLAEELFGTAVDELGKIYMDNEKSDNDDGPRGRNTAT